MKSFWKEIKLDEAGFEVAARVRTGLGFGVWGRVRWVGGVEDPRGGGGGGVGRLSVGQPCFFHL